MNASSATPPRQGPISTTVSTGSPPGGAGGSDYAASLRAYHQSLQAQILQDIWEPPSAQQAAHQKQLSSSSTAGSGSRWQERRRRSSTHPEQRRRSSTKSKCNEDASGGESFSDKERRARLAEGEAVKRIRRQGFRQDSQDNVGSLRSLASKERTLAVAAAGIPVVGGRGEGGQGGDDGGDDVPAACGSSVSSSSCLSSDLPVSPRSDDEQQGQEGEEAVREGSTTPPTSRLSGTLAVLAEQERRGTALGSLPMPRPPKFSRNKTSDSIITIRSARSAASSTLDPYYLESAGLEDGGISDSDESFVALAPSPMWTPGAAGASSTTTMHSGALFGPPPTTQSNPLSSLNPSANLMTRRQSPSSRNIKVEYLLAGRALPSPLRIEASSQQQQGGGDSSSSTDAARLTLEPSDIAELRRSLAMKTIHTPATEKVVVDVETSVEASPLVLTPACEAPAAFANNPRAPRVCMMGAAAAAATSTEFASQEMQQSGSSSSTSSSDAAATPLRPFRRCTFQRPHHKNGRGKGRGGSYNKELEQQEEA